MANVDMTTVTDNTTETPPINPLDEVFTKIDEMAVLAAYLKKVVKPLLKKGARPGVVPPMASAPNGFQSVMMAPVLVDFLNKNFPDRGIVLDTPLPRTDVTQLMTTYIKTSNLQLAENRKTSPLMHSCPRSSTSKRATSQTGLRCRSSCGPSLLVSSRTQTTTVGLLLR